MRVYYFDFHLYTFDDILYARYVNAHISLFSISTTTKKKKIYIYMITMIVCILLTLYCLVDALNNFLTKNNFSLISSFILT